MNEGKMELEEFLLDIECLDELNNWTYKQNIFDILKVTNTEIRHSNFLAWLLNPSESHGFCDEILKKVVIDIVAKNKEFYESKSINVINLALMDYSNFIILREWKDIDLLAVAHEQKILLAFENKIWSTESSHQLNKYREILDKTYGDYKKILVYLTPYGEEPSDLVNWIPYDYNSLMRIIENELMKNKSISNDITMLVRHYIDSVRRNVVGDQDLVAICESIYRKHKLALDLIFDNRPDNLYNVAELIKELLIEREKNEGDIQFYEGMMSKSIIRFKTPTMNELLPVNVEKKGGWNTGDSIFCEVENRDTGIRVKVVLANVDTERAEKYIRIGQKKQGKESLKSSWKWKTLNSWLIKDMKKIDYNWLDEDEKEKFKSNLKKQLYKRIDELLDFEKHIKECWDKEY